MADGEVLIFLSYAHDDDLTMSSSEDETGFVTFLDKKLELKLRELGASRAKIWIDRKRISDGDLFDGAIDEGLRKAGLLLVVMSNNWMQRPYCQKELETFADLRRKSGVPNIQERMIVVGKGHVDRMKRPFDLQGQEGFLFYARDESNGVSDVKPFYKRGKAADQFYDRLDGLAGLLQKRVDAIVSGGAMAAASPLQPPIATRNGRTIYLSKPASDMKEAYARLAFELQGKGFAVVPEVTADLPDDTRALAVIDGALAQAEASVHLVGEKTGFAPEGLDPIVKLQLARARERSPQSADASQVGFRRIIWAPKVVDTAGLSSSPTAERDPLQSLERCDKQIGADKVDGDILSKFIEFLFQYLAETAPRRVPKTSADSKSEIYLAYHGADEDYAGAIVEALRGSPVKIQIPAAGSDAETRRYNDDLLMNCDGVTLCWANASEVWVRSEADRLKDWEALGRKQQFAFRNLIAGPPPAAHKRAQFMKLLFQDGQFDKVLDLVDKGSPTPELLGDLAGSPAGPGP